jgi:S1-C subfamily serine protease
MIALMMILALGDDGIAYRMTLDSTVYIRSTDGKAIHAGTGVVVGPGLILTAHHVVGIDENPKFYFPFRKDGAVVTEVSHYTNAYHSKVVANDPKRDLALLRIIGPLDPKPVPLALKSAEPGDALFTIGNSDKVLWQYSGGNCRQVYDDDCVLSNGQKLTARVVEMTCVIQPGASGGPILNSKGELVGTISNYMEGKNQQRGIDITEIHAFLKWAKQ